MNKRGCRYEHTTKKIEIGKISSNWTCVALYPNFNLWIKKAETNGYIIRECFPVNTVPNENANYDIAL